MDTDKIQAAINAQAQLPRPPEGFAWKLYGEATFLKPISWHEHEHVATTNAFPTTTYATSPESFSKTKPFEMGLTLQVMRDSFQNIKVDAKQIADAYLQPHLDTHKKYIIHFERNANNHVDLTTLRYKDAPPGLKPLIVHKHIMADAESDTVHIFTFESPEKSWDQNWKKFGTPILSQLRVNTIVTLADAEDAQQLTGHMLQ